MPFSISIQFWRDHVQTFVKVTLQDLHVIFKSCVICLQSPVADFTPQFFYLINTVNNLLPALENEIHCEIDIFSNL